MQGLHQSSQQAFRLLDLPLELQRIVLEKYFEDGFVVESTWSIRTQGGGYVVRRGRRIDAWWIFLVNRHINKEAKAALIQSKAGTFALDLRQLKGGKIRTEVQPPYFYQAISTLVLDMPSSGFATRPHLTKFPHLRNINFGTEYRTEKLRDLLGCLITSNSPTVDRVVRGLYNKELERAAVSDFLWSGGLRWPDCHNEQMHFVWTVQLLGHKLRVSLLDKPGQTRLRKLHGYVFCLEFEHDESGCHVRRKWFRKNVWVTPALTLVELQEQLKANNNIEEAALAQEKANFARNLGSPRTIIYRRPRGETPQRRQYLLKCTC